MIDFLMANPSIFIDYYDREAKDDFEVVEKLMWDKDFRKEVEEARDNAEECYLTQLQYVH